MLSTSAPHLLEASWEVGNKVGGIYTSVSSKLVCSLGEFPDRYLAIGPYLSSTPNPIFEEQPLPVRFKGVAVALEKSGVSLHYGSWQVMGNPPTVLLGWEGLLPHLNDYKARFWQEFQLDTLDSDFYDFDQPLLWSIAVGLLVENFSLTTPAPLIFHGHEWMSAGALLILKDSRPNLQTVFTTHATVLGRLLSAHPNVPSDLASRENPEEIARASGVHSKYQLEKLGANLAKVLTTVSPITAEEVTVYLGRKPDFITENGLNAASFPPLDQLALLKTKARKQIDEYLMAIFFPSYQFNLKNTIYHFSMGRFELHNKGYDLYLQALGQLNQKLRQENSEQTVVSFLLIPGDVKGPKPECLKQLLSFQNLQSKLKEIFSEQSHSIYDTSISELTERLQKEIETFFGAHRQLEPPPFSPFELQQGENDPLLLLIKEAGLHNRSEDRVKIVYFPVYFDGQDGIFNLPLYPFIAGFDLGVFPSLYEPWGYTPMESLAMGVPAVTTTTAGFGRSIQEKHPETPAGVFLLDRRGLAEQQSLLTLIQFLESSVQEDKRKWLSRQISAYQIIQDYSWDNLYQSYRQAYYFEGG